MDYPKERLQILVAADGSNDRTAEIVQQFAGRGVELLYQPERRGKMAAINRAMSQARGEIIVFSDANNLYQPDALSALAAPFNDPQVGAVSGAKHVVRGDGALGESEGLYWKYESLIKRQETRLGSCTGVSGEILAIRKVLFQTPPAYVINDDFYIAMQVIRQGYRLIYTPAARSYERVSPTAQDEIARRSRIIAGRYQAIWLSPQYLTWRNPWIIWQVVSHKFLRPLVPLAMIGAFIANLWVVLFPPANSSLPLFALTAPFSSLFLGLQIFFYLLAWLGGRFPSNKFLYLPAFLVNSNLAALIGLYRFLTRKQTSLWQRVARR